MQTRDQSNFYDFMAYFKKINDKMSFCDHIQGQKHVSLR